MVEYNRKENAMKKLIIDARESGTTTGRYIDKLIEYLHELNTGLEITVLTKPHRVDFLTKLPKILRLSNLLTKNLHLLNSLD